MLGLSGRPSELEVRRVASRHKKSSVPGFMRQSKRTGDYRELKCPISLGETNRDLTLIYSPIEYDEISLFWYNINTILRELIFV